MSTTKKIALGGIITAFSSVIITISNIIPMGLYSFPALAGIIIYIFSCLAGKSYALSAYTASSIISLLICTDKEAAVCFLLFLGYYPLLKAYIEKIKVKFISYLIKFVIFNAAVFFVYIVTVYVFFVPIEKFEILGINVPLFFIIILNFTFILYDYALSLFKKSYEKDIIKNITKIFK